MWERKAERWIPSKFSAGGAFSLCTLQSGGIGASSLLILFIRRADSAFLFGHRGFIEKLCHAGGLS